MRDKSSHFHLYLQDEWLAYDIRELVRLFIDLEQVDVHIDAGIHKDSPVAKPGLVCDYGADDGSGRSWLRLNDQTIEVAHHPQWQHHPQYKRHAKRKFLKGVYYLMQDWKPTKLPWGTLTGVRPVKLAHQLLRRFREDDFVRQTLREEYALEEDKARLVTEIAHRQQPLLQSVKDKSVSLYIGIPLCPSRCSYCSFISQAVSGRDDPLIAAYLEALLIELKGALAWLQQGQWHLDTLYIGGGTPSVLSAEQISELMKTLSLNWPLETLREITFEAGRPDTITAEKLKVLKQYPVNRISINPQTMQPETLTRINRCHTVEEFYQAWQLATDLGFETINLDLIVGLPGEGEEQLRHTLAAIEPLKPANVTIHALALKRSSTLKTDTMKHQVSDTEAAEMMNRIYAFAQTQGLVPYYLYRQKEMAGHLENVGFSKPGREGLYNILMMEEKQTIMGIGAGAVSKLYFPETDRIERKPNVKNIQIYIDRMKQQGFDKTGWNQAFSLEKQHGKMNDNQEE